MTRFSQIRYSSGPGQGPGGLLGRIVAAIVAIIVLGMSIFVGAVFIVAIVGLVLLGGIVFAVRVWWLKRQMARFEAEHGDLEGEFTVVETEIREIERKNKYKDS